MAISIPSFDWLIIAPELIVLITALLVMGVDLVLPREQKGRLAWLSLVGLLAAGVVSFARWDGSDPVLHSMLAADGYALFLNLVILTAAALATLLSVGYIARLGPVQGEFHTLLLLSTAGMMLMAGAVHLMTLFLALEIMSVALYVLVGLRRTERRSAEAALKYLLLGAFASGFLLYGMALIYGQAGTMALSGIRAYVQGLDGFPPLLAVGLGLMVVGFGFKTALFPFHMWAPDVYQGAPTPVTAFMSVGVKAAAFAALGRVMVSVFGPFQPWWGWGLALLAALTMTVGNLIALRQRSLKRLLAYSSIAHAGYAAVGLAAGTEAGLAAVLFYLLAYAVMNVGAFAVVVAVEPPDAVDVEIAAVAGLAARRRGLAVALSLFLFSLAGLPPLVGFIAKLGVFGAAVRADLTWLAVVGVVNSVISAYYYLRVAAALWRGEGPDAGATDPPLPLAWQAAVGLTAAATVLLGVWPQPLLELARLAAAALLGR